MVVGGGNLSNGMEALVKHVPPEALCIIYTFLYDFFFFLLYFNMQENFISLYLITFGHMIMLDDNFIDFDTFFTSCDTDFY